MRHYLTTIIVTVITVLVIQNISASQSPQDVIDNPIYNRIKDSNTLRCGYAIWQPAVMHDPNTGEYSGIFYDYVMALADRLQLQVEWVEETGFGEVAQGIEAGRFDLFCAGLWPTALTAKSGLEVVDPVFYNVVEGYVRAGDKRFDNNWSVLNSAEHTIATIDGEMAAIIAQTQFPNAKTLSSPQLTRPDTNLLQVATGKADITFTDSITGGNYVRGNPNKMRQVKRQFPVRFYASGLGILSSEIKLKTMLHAAHNELLHAGIIDYIISKYEKRPGELMRPGSIALTVAR